MMKNPTSYKKLTDGSWNFELICDMLYSFWELEEIEATHPRKKELTEAGICFYCTCPQFHHYHECKHSLVTRSHQQCTHTHALDPLSRTHSLAPATRSHSLALSLSRALTLSRRAPTLSSPTRSDPLRRSASSPRRRQSRRGSRPPPSASARPRRVLWSASGPAPSSSTHNSSLLVASTPHLLLSSASPLT
jgi:hypothetical protein